MSGTVPSSCIGEFVEPELQPAATSGVVLTVSTSLRYPGPVAVWILVAGWAAAARARYGNAWILTPDGVVTAETALELASRKTAGGRDRRRSWHLPLVMGTLKNDVSTAIRSYRFRSSATRGAWSASRLRFVWQYHSLFDKAGFVAARRSNVPLVLFVDAPVVWEGEKWGVRRPGWGSLIERIGELPQLRAADLVACVSDEVAEVVRSKGVPVERIIVTPCGVDPSRFHPRVSGTLIRERWNIEGRFVVGWVGSFRRFHGLDLLIDCFAEFERLRPDATLLLVGDGLDRPRLQSLAVTRRLRNVIFTGNAPYSEMPQFAAALDVGVVLDPAVAGFHYSPLKLREYMATGRAVIAPRSGEIGRTLRDDHEAILIEPGDRGALLAALLRVHDDVELRRRLGTAARHHVLTTATWSNAIDTTEAALSLLASS